jgi:ornithine carbamoyltransferase
MSARPRSFIDLWSFDAADLRNILLDARRRKAARAGWPKGRADADAPGQGRTLAMVFQKSSTRTWFSFDAAIRQIGGASVISTEAQMQLGRGETIEDTARVLSRMVDAVMIRANRHEDVEALAAAADIPVINGLSDAGHPCQIMADLMTFEEHRGPLAGRTIAWVGDGNNVCASFIQAAPKFGYRLRIATPAAYAPDRVDVARAAEQQGRIEVGEDPRAAVEGADLVVADTWVSMGDTGAEARLAALEPYQVTEPLMALAASGGVRRALHALPAGAPRRGGRRGGDRRAALGRLR